MVYVSLFPIRWNPLQIQQTLPKILKSVSSFALPINFKFITAGSTNTAQDSPQRTFQVLGVAFVYPNIIYEQTFHDLIQPNLFIQVLLKIYDSLHLVNSQFFQVDSHNTWLILFYPEIIGAMLTDLIVAGFYESYQVAAVFWDVYESMVTLQAPYMREITTVANAINGCLGIHSVLKAQPQPSYWLYSLVMSYLSAFGGGTVAPTLIGKASFALNNDLVFVVCILVWYWLNHLHGDYFVNQPLVRCVWMFLLGIFRTNSVVSMVIIANGVFAPSKYYPTAMFGPIVMGWVTGSFGQFLPFDKGLNPIKNGTIWSIQAAFLTASFYHIMINDKTGFVGTSLRSIVGTYSPSTVMMILATMQIVQVYLQYFLHPDANIFAPVHKVFYVLFQLEGPKSVPAPTTKGDYVGWNIRARERLRIMMDVGRVLLVVMTLACHVFVMVVPTHLPSSSSAIVQWNPLPMRSNATLGLEPRLLTLSFHEYQSQIQRRSLPLRRSIGLCQWLKGTAMGSTASDDSLLTNSSCHPYFLKFEPITSESGDISSVSQQYVEYRLAMYEKVIMKMIWDGAVKDIRPIYVSPSLKLPAHQESLQLMNSDETQLVVADNGVVYVIYNSSQQASQVTFSYVPWMKFAPFSDDAHVGICGQLLPVESTDNSWVVASGVTELAEIDEDLSSQKQKNRKKNNNNRSEKLESKYLELIASDRVFADLGNIHLTKPISYFTLSPSDGRVVAYCTPTTTSLVLKTISNFPGIVKSIADEAIRVWSDRMDKLLPKNSVATEL